MQPLEIYLISFNTTLIIIADLYRIIFVTRINQCTVNVAEQC